MKSKFLSFALTIIAVATQAAPIPPNRFPAELLFMGKPIDAYCFSDLDKPVVDIQLKNCGATHAKLTVKKEPNDYLVKQDFAGYDWTDAENQANGSSYYQAFPAEQKKFWIYTLNNGGGTGNFTSIYLLTRKNTDIVEVKGVVAGGDRCNGGIEKVDAKNNKLHYSISLTAADILSMIKENPKVKAYDDISACASCCFATAEYEMDASLTPTLQYVDFGSTDNPAEMPEQGTYQKCFNKLFASYVAKGKNKLDKAALTQFNDEFNKQCVGN